ncbi:MAG: ybaK/ebsC protein [Lacrimispora sp.]|jgi:Cys-tRNA(Pro)/Cys-tRNA(Cys) deacylase|nr:ybaK/ebsC protein [Lacrimispora sp.]
MIKTNAMRMLDKAGIAYDIREYTVDEQDLSGSHAADMLGVDHGSVFKTLVLKGEKTGYFVCCIPVDGELDLKKTAKLTGDKKVEMISVKDLLSVTGYIRGGCSPVGMKKHFPTWIDITAENYPEIVVSAGVRGQQIVIEPKRLADFTKGKFASFMPN